MKIVIDRSSGPNDKLVSHVSVDKVDAGLRVVITATMRNPNVASSYGRFGGGLLRRVGWCIDNGDPETRFWETVELIPDNKREENMLEGLGYTLYNKDQIEILIVPWNRLKTLKEVADISAE